MVSVRRISYRWQLFVPTILALWALVIGLAWWQMSREMQFRRNYVNAHLDLVNNRIVDALENDKADINADFLEFVDNYYEKLALFSKIRITLYDKDWNVVHAVGAPIILTEADKKESKEQIIERQTRLPSLNHKHFFYKGLATSDHEYYVLSALPIEGQLEEYLYGDRWQVWGTIILLTLGVSILIIYMAHRFYHNLRLLRAFARRSATDHSFTPNDDFSSDEMGDVARQIVSLYNERVEAGKQIEQEHLMAVKAIEERAAQKRQLTNNINHELKTPIAVIKGYLDTIAGSPDLPPEVRNNFIQKARMHANRLADLMADISVITRLQEGGEDIPTEALDFHELVYTFAGDISETGLIGTMTFTYDIPPKTYVMGNANLLTGMLMNLTKNACNYSGGTKCAIEFTGLSEDGKSYEFAFYDDGIGVPESSLLHILERFYRIDSGRTRKTGGSGLGLAIVANTIRAHKGKIDCNNRPGMGFQVLFALPRADTRVPVKRE